MYTILNRYIQSVSCSVVGKGCVQPYSNTACKRAAPHYGHVVMRMARRR